MTPANVDAPRRSERNVLIVSPYFPPSTVAGVHRARLLAKHLPAVGWNPVVLCVDEKYHEECLDPDLAFLLPDGLRVVKVPAISSQLTRAFGVGEVSLRAWPAIQRAVLKILGTNKIDVVLITGSPFYPMLLAPSIKRKFGLPVVLDFQDPWVSSYGARQALWSKAGISYQLAVRLEPRALRGAAFVTSVSEIQNREMAERYTWLDSSLMAAIPIGGDPDDFVFLRAAGKMEAVPLGGEGFIELSYVGAYWPAARAPFTAFLRGLRRLLDVDPDAARKLRVNFVGTDATLRLASPRIIPMAKEEGVADMIREFPDRLPFLDALDVLARSDGIILIGSDEPHYTASKVFTCLMSRRPFLSFYHQSSSAHAILSNAGGGLALGFAGREALEGTEPMIAEAVRRLAFAPESLGQVDPSSYAAFSARAVAERYTQIFDKVTGC